MLELLNAEMIERNIPHISVSTGDNELLVNCLGIQYRITSLTEKNTYFLWNGSKNTAICFSTTESILSYLNILLRTDIEGREQSIKRRVVTDLFAEDVVFGVWATGMPSVIAKIPHVNNNRIKKLFGWNSYCTIHIMYDRTDNCYSISTHDNDGKFVMLGLTHTYYDIGQLVSSSLKHIIGFHVKGKFTDM